MNSFNFTIFYCIVLGEIRCFILGYTVALCSTSQMRHKTFGNKIFAEYSSLPRTNYLSVLEASINPGVQYNNGRITETIPTSRHALHEPTFLNCIFNILCAFEMLDAVNNFRKFCQSHTYTMALAQFCLVFNEWNPVHFHIFRWTSSVSCREWMRGQHRSNGNIPRVVSAKCVNVHGIEMFHLCHFLSSPHSCWSPIWLRHAYIRASFNTHASFIVHFSTYTERCSPCIENGKPAAAFLTCLFVQNDNDTHAATTTINTETH